VSYPHIEHFRPKSRYPKQCFVWENLLLGCSICNGAAFKHDKFPLNKDGGPLINPETENPASFFDFIFDAKVGVAYVRPKNVRAETTEVTLGLNRPDLERHRSAFVRKIAFIALKASQGDVNALTELKFCMQPDQEYSAFAIAFHQKFKLP
jgi:uncharacterized protein (TIGR02646 family)